MKLRELGCTLEHDPNANKFSLYFRYSGEIKPGYEVMYIGIPVCEGHQITSSHGVRVVPGSFFAPSLTLSGTYALIFHPRDALDEGFVLAVTPRPTDIPSIEQCLSTDRWVVREEGVGRVGTVIISKSKITAPTKC